MAKLKQVPVEEVSSPVQATVVPPAPPVPAVSFTPPQKLLEVDKLALDLARSKRQTALAEAKTALAQNENAELNYKYVILQLYMKYHLTDRDAISENGDIIIDGAVNQQAR